MAEQYPELWIIEPKEATNLITNPSFETNTTGWAAVGASVTIAQSAAYQRRGVYSCKITPPSGNQISGIYFGTFALSSGTTYYLSLDVLDVLGQGYNLYFANTSAVMCGTATEWTGTGHWARHVVSWTCDSSASYRLYLTRDSVASTSPFYVDGAQCESASESTYFDGDYNGFNPLRQDYYWHGVAHGSTSYRSGRTRTGGTLLRVRDYAKILGIAGMGMAPVENYALPVGKSGSQYQGTRVNDRELTVYLRFYGATTDVMRDNRAQIVDAVKMDNVPDDEPVIMRYRLDTSAGAQVSEVLDMHLLYSGGLEDDTSEPGSQIVSKAAVQFTAYTPGLMLDGEAGAALGFVGTITQSQYMVYRSASGQWSSLGSINGPVYALARTPSGSVIAGGAFTVFGGAAGTGLVSLVGTASTQVGAGFTIGTVMTISPDANGGMFVGGYGPGSVLRYFSGTTVTNSSKLTGTIFASCVGDDGICYFGGAMGTVPPLDSFHGVGYWDGTSTISSDNTMNGGFNSDFARIMGVCYQNGNVYVGGYTSTATRTRTAPTASGSAIYGIWNTTATASGWAAGTLANIRSFDAAASGPDGHVYWGGYGTATSGTLSGTVSQNIWRGTASPILIYSALSSAPETVYDIAWDKQANMYVVGSYWHDWGGGSITDPAMVHRAGAWWQLDIDTGCGTAEAISAILVTPTNEIYMAGNWTSGTATTASGTVLNCASARAYPRVFFTGPGKLIQLVNYSTGRGIYFNGLTLQAGERAIFDFRPGRFKFESNWRGNLMKYIAAGSDLDMILLAGNNTISCYMTSTTAASAITMAWLPVYVSLDGAMW